MRVVLGLLLLALCGSGAQGEDGGLGEVGEISESQKTDIWAEVRALRDKVVKLEVHVELLQRENYVLTTEVISLKTRLTANERKTSDLEKENADLQTRVSSTERELLASKSRIDQLEIKNADLQTRLSSTEKELLVMKSRIDQLERENAAQASDLKSLETRLTATERKTSDLEDENADLQSRVSSTESELLIIKSRIAQLERENAERPKVAFYTAVTNVGHVGPYNTDFPLTHNKVFTNFGNGYNPATGYFTAPVKGVYYLQFTVCSHRAGPMGLFVHKNNQRIVFNARWHKAEGFDYITNSVVLELLAGDRINLVLPAGISLYDDGNNHSTFTGALLFPL